MVAISYVIASTYLICKVRNHKSTSLLSRSNSSQSYSSSRGTEIHSHRQQTAAQNSPGTQARDSSSRKPRLSLNRFCRSRFILCLLMTNDFLLPVWSLLLFHSSLLSKNETNQDKLWKSNIPHMISLSLLLLCNILLLKFKSDRFK